VAEYPWRFSSALVIESGSAHLISSRTFDVSAFVESVGRVDGDGGRVVGEGAGGVGLGAGGRGT
jgi:hypothetical protein